MSFDRKLFADKVRRYRQQFQLSVVELASRCGAAVERVAALEGGEAEPTGDEVLILSDVFKCDYRFFISNETLAPFEETEELFRRHGDNLSREDRWAIQEFLYLCECEAFLLVELGRSEHRSFEFTPRGTYYKGHGTDAAKAFRRKLGLDPLADVTDVFGLLRRLGLRVFRRALGNSDISGLFIDHPVAGPCVLVNYSEDLWRQRFTALHEACHAYLDRGDRVVVSFTKWDRDQLIEIPPGASRTGILHRLPPTWCSTSAAVAPGRHRARPPPTPTGARPRRYGLPAEIEHQVFQPCSARLTAAIAPAELPQPPYNEPLVSLPRRAQR